MLQSQLRQRLDRIDHSLRILRRRAHQRDRVRRDSRSTSLTFHAETRVQRRDHRLHVEILARLDERHMRRLRQHDLRRRDLRLHRSRTVAIRPHRQHDALRAARAHRADDLFAAAQQCGRHPHDLALEALQALERPGFNALQSKNRLCACLRNSVCGSDW
jgi:hypothetical protein